MPGEGKDFSPLEEVRPQEKESIFCRDLQCLHEGKQFRRYGCAFTPAFGREEGPPDIFLPGPSAQADILRAFSA